MIVVDDCSTDETAEIARKLGSTVIRHDRNRGESAARNTGIEAASQPWIALLDSDDEWRPGHLAHLFQLCGGHVLASSATLARGPDPSDHRIYGVPGPSPRILRTPGAVAVVNCVPPSSTILNRAAAIDAGGFDSTLPLCADLDMWIRLLEQGTGVASPQVGSIYHVHGGQVSSDSSAMRTAHLEILKSYRGRDWWSERLFHNCEGALEWDSLRSGISERDPAHVVRSSARIFRHPSCAVGVVRVLDWRRKLRRRSLREPR